MAEDKRTTGKHKIVVEEREHAMIEGVTEVISFDEESVVCETDLGSLIIKGSNLHVEKLNLDQGQLNVIGDIESLDYSAEGAFSKNSGGFLGRIFR